MKKITVPEIVGKKSNKEKIVMVTAYDADTACILDEAGVDIILVGDSLGNVVQGRENTIPVTMDDMIYHTKIVSRGMKNAFLCADMPFMSYQVSIEDAIANAGRFLQEATAESVKLEVNESQLEKVYSIVNAGIPVVGHIGLCPQSVHIMGGYRMQGKERKQAARLEKLAKSVEEAGAFCLVLESIPAKLARKITSSINIPTIGIGAGPHCDGQVLVINDLVGLSPDPIPSFVKKYANARKIYSEAVRKFAREVKNGNFPGKKYFIE